VPRADTDRDPSDHPGARAPRQIVAAMAAVLLDAIESDELEAARIAHAAIGCLLGLADEVQVLAGRARRPGA
jgi:hypothetical protein